MPPKIFIIAGEPSGDLIGANLIKSLKLLLPNCSIYGVGGSKMISQGLNSIFDIEEISIMGYIEVLPKIFKIKKLLTKTYQEIIKINPDVIITIDSPGFNLRLIKRLRKYFGNKIKIVNYVAPSVWAYKPKRIYRVKALYDHQLLILPIEKPYFDTIGFPSTFVGHPILEEPLVQSLSKEETYTKYNVPLKNKLLTIMPGSRKGELKKHIPIFIEALKNIKNKQPNITLFIPTLPHLEEILKKEFGQFSPLISSDSKTKDELLFASDVALVKSGTSSLELMRYNLPMIVAYKVSGLTAFILKFFITTKYFALPNIILQEEVVPELIQDKCTAENISKALYVLLNNKEKQDYQKEKFNLALNMFNVKSGEKPGMLAAKKIAELL
ncbi:lipid-A-disaccharide synthase [endosymbiont of Acanthamoeba sp. UWC8]|uniref:lipid-A-disaccharide synthase n=1 Tax=endosymbiont of Acanthamoeba sp. UWC8 TaxID=86106 RepID=UPI0004D17469|nr:lipid-A-disaccharide synthase [endosymbiont of Acanthamoeba sp. UWC8]AIF81564.1 lipid-A-disaccharide synthase [endosymbiont of Acanthamoeba sp. UWC8]